MNCIIVDDEYSDVQELSYYIDNFSTIKILYVFDDSMKALEYVQNHSVDVIFFDIAMPKIDGLAFSRVTYTLKIRPLIILTSTSKEYAFDAYEAAAFDYLLKPYCETRIKDVLQRIQNLTNFRYSTNKITLWKNGKISVLNINDILYCEAHEHEVHVYTTKEQYKVSSSISEFNKKLSQDIFFKCHRSYIVNLDKIIEITPWFHNTYMLKLQGTNTEIPVSRQNTTLFKIVMGI